MPLSPNELNRYRQKCPPKGQESCCSGNNCVPLQRGEVILPCPQRMLIDREVKKLNSLSGVQRNIQAKRINRMRNSLTEIWEEACGTKVNVGGRRSRRGSKKGGRKTRRN